MTVLVDFANDLFSADLRDVPFGIRTEKGHAPQSI